MKPNKTSLPTEYRLARLAAWALAVIAWLLHCPGLPRTAADRRHQRRYAHVTIRKLQRFIAHLIIFHALQFLPVRPGPRRRLNHARAGFQRRIRPRLTLRRVGGVWMRPRLAVSGSFAEQLAQLAARLRDWRKLGAAFARHRAKGLARLCPIIIVRAPHDQVRTLAAPPAFAADSS
jgi:hypothetical protein